MSVCFIEDGPAEDDHVEDDDEAVKYREGGHLSVLISSCWTRLEFEFLFFIPVQKLLSLFVKLITVFLCLMILAPAT